MQLYEFGISRSARVHWVLREAGVQYEAISVNLIKGEQKSPGFLAINPYGKLPVLVDGDCTLTESAAICTYIAEKFPAAALIPAQATVARAHYFQWICFCIAEMEPQLWSIRKNMILYPKPQRSHMALRVGRMEYENAATMLENHLSGNQYVLGDIFSAADIVVAYDLIWAGSLKLLAKFPVLRAYEQRLRQRPAFPDFLFTESVRQGNLI